MAVIDRFSFHHVGSDGLRMSLGCHSFWLGALTDGKWTKCWKWSHKYKENFIHITFLYLYAHCLISYLITGFDPAAVLMMSQQQHQHPHYQQQQQVASDADFAAVAGQRRASGRNGRQAGKREFCKQQWSVMIGLMKRCRVRLPIVEDGVIRSI